MQTLNWFRAINWTIKTKNCNCQSGLTLKGHATQDWRAEAQGTRMYYLLFAGCVFRWLHFFLKSYTTRVNGINFTTQEIHDVLEIAGDGFACILSCSQSSYSCDRLIFRDIQISKTRAFWLPRNQLETQSDSTLSFTQVWFSTIWKNSVSILKIFIVSWYQPFNAFCQSRHYEHDWFQSEEKFKVLFSWATDRSIGECDAESSPTLMPTQTPDAADAHATLGDGDSDCSDSVSGVCDGDIQAVSNDGAAIWLKIFKLRLEYTWYIPRGHMTSIYQVYPSLKTHIVLRLGYTWYILYSTNWNFLGVPDDFHHYPSSCSAFCLLQPNLFQNPIKNDVLNF